MNNSKYLFTNTFNHFNTSKHLMNEIFTLMKRAISIEEQCIKNNKIIINDLDINNITENTITINKNDIKLPTKVDILIKKLYKIIAKFSHPDRCSDKTKQTIFNDANQSYKEKSLRKLVYLIILCDLYVDIDNDEIQELQIERDLLEEDINLMKRTLIYNWNNLNEKDKQKYKQEYENMK